MMQHHQSAHFQIQNLRILLSLPGGGRGGGRGECEYEDGGTVIGSLGRGACKIYQHMQGFRFSATLPTLITCVSSMVSTKQMPPNAKQNTADFTQVKLLSSNEPPAITFYSSSSSTPSLIHSPPYETQPAQSHRSSAQGWQSWRGRTTEIS